MKVVDHEQLTAETKQIIYPQKVYFRLNARLLLIKQEFTATNRLF